MKKLSHFYRYSFAFLALWGILFQGCMQDKCKTTYRYMKYSPVYMNTSDFRAATAVKTEAPRALSRPGKIYTYGKYLLVNEIAKGVHIINNENPANPVKVAFLSIPGNYDMAVKDGMLYCDSSIDLLVFELGNIENPVLVNRIANTFPHLLSYSGYQADPALGIVVDWKDEIVTGEVDNCNGNIPNLWTQNTVPVSNDLTNDQKTSAAVPAGSGKAGSMTRFAVKDNNLYVIAPKELKIYSLSGANVAHTSDISLTNLMTDAETVFPYKDLLFIGAMDGMLIMNNSNPSNPTQLGQYTHMRSCDPVVANDNFAYVSLNNDVNNPCDGYSNQIDIVDIQTPSQPSLTRTYPMTQPKGIGIDNNILFVCDGKDGLKVFDANFPESLKDHQLASFTDMKGYDLIPNDGVLIMVGKDGIAQYDYSNVKSIKLLSKILVN
jgi:hypothetical protein